MDAKFLKKVEEYRYALVCDIAQYQSGFVLLDIKEDKVVKLWQLSVNKESTEPTGEMYVKLENIFEEIQNEYKINMEDDLLVIKEQLPANCGPYSTAATLQALAAAHAAFNIYVYKNKLKAYGNGIHAISVKSFFRHITGLEKPQKDDIKNVVCERYNLSEDITRDQSDAIALWMSLSGEKWNKDIDEQIKVVKKHKKTLKAKNAINDCDKEIQRLEDLKWEEVQFTMPTSPKIGPQSGNKIDN